MMSSFRSKRITFVALLTAPLFFGGITSTAWAAIAGTGDVNPPEPITWDTGTNCYAGQSSRGTITVDAGNGQLSSDDYLGKDSGAAGTTW
jgi:hypothetical protein